MDLGDPRENLVSLKDHAYWEADNRVEERWQWGAQILDLCNLSPEDYKNSTDVTVKSIKDCGECGGGGSKVDENKGNAEIPNDGNFNVQFGNSVASNLYVFVTFTDGNDTEHKFDVEVPKGSKGATFDVSTISPTSPYKIKSIKVGFKQDGSDAADSVKDNKYEYSVDFEGDVVGKTYTFSILCTETDNLTGEDYLSIIESQGVGFDYLASYDEINFEEGDIEQEVVFFVPCNNVEEYMPEIVEQEYFTENSYDYVIITQKNIMEIKEDFTNDTEKWEKSSINIKGEPFSLYMRRDFSGTQCRYTVGSEPCQGADIEFVVKISE